MLQKTPSLLRNTKHPVNQVLIIDATKLKTLSKSICSHRLFKIAHKEGQVFDSIPKTAGYLFFLKNVREHFVNICPELSCSGQAPLSHDEEMKDYCSQMMKNILVEDRQQTRCFISVDIVKRNVKFTADNIPVLMHLLRREEDSFFVKT